jgi:branched-chain amino acid transport system permease protein
MRCPPQLLRVERIRRSVQLRGHGCSALVVGEARVEQSRFVRMRASAGGDSITVVLADQMLREFGGLAERMVWPGSVTHFLTIAGQRYATTRLFMLAVAVVIGVLLWQWLSRSRMGMVIRAGVDDRQMVRGLGINIRLVFAVTFFVGSFLAGVGGVLAASFAGAAPGTDGNWLLNALVVVIIGGLGSIKGAAAGSLLYGTVVAFSPAYLPSQYSFYAIIVTFALLALVLAIRPYGLFGRPS